MGGLTEEELEASVSTVSMGSYRRAPGWDQPKILEWVPRLRQMPDEEFVLECSSKILDSAIMNRFKGDAAWGSHARADICVDEAQRRHQTAGHAADCRGDNLYSKAMNQVRKSQGHAPNPPVPCTCDPDEEKKGD